MGIYGETVSQKTARQIAAAFSNAASGKVMAEPKMVYNGRRLTTDALFIPFYVYNLAGGGYVVVSAENKAMPILAYNLAGQFDATDAEAPVRALLQQFAGDIERIRYNSETPEVAIRAWGNINEYINDILTAPEVSYAGQIPAENAATVISRVADEGDIRYSSAIYTPAQWRDAVSGQLTMYGSAAVGIIAPRKVLPIELTGLKGNYFRLSDGSYALLLATEILSEGQVAFLGNPKPYDDLVEEEKPFTFLDNFEREIREGVKRAENDISESVTPAQPVVLGLGGGHYTILMPEPAVLARVFNISGAYITENKYQKRSAVNLDLSNQPAGVYIVLVVDTDGKPYGFKLVR